MAKVQVLLEFTTARDGAFESFSLAATSDVEAEEQAMKLVAKLTGLGLELDERSVPVPMFSGGKAKPDARALEALGAFASLETNQDMAGRSTVVAAEVDRARLEDLAKRSDVMVWPNSPLTLFGRAALHDLAPSSGGVDCRPFRPGVEIATIREMLGTAHVWASRLSGPERGRRHHRRGGQRSDLPGDRRLQPAQRGPAPRRCGHHQPRLDVCRRHPGGGTRHPALRLSLPRHRQLGRGAARCSRRCWSSGAWTARRS